MNSHTYKLKTCFQDSVLTFTQLLLFPWTSLVIDVPEAEYLQRANTEMSKCSQKHNHGLIQENIH